ncbi:MAG: glycosyltransferase family 4 protein [Acidimicrobiales bacterium]
MRPSRIDQVVPSLGGRDAIGVHVILLRDVLRDLGFASDIWCMGAFPETRSMVRFTDDLPTRERPDTWWLYHLSSGSPVGDLIAARPEPKMVDYHNITPAHLFGGWVPWATEEADAGLAQLELFTGVSFFGFADSGFNALDLEGSGMPKGRTVVVPPLFDPVGLAAKRDARLESDRRAERAGGGADWLFVGRVTPAKAQHDLVKALACYRQEFDPLARLHLVGTSMGDDYPRALERYARRLGISDAVRLTGSVSEDELASYYRTSDVFVCASEHEGFCIPLVEAMGFGIPVVAFDAGAIAETAQNGALVLEDKSPLGFATAVDRVMNDRTLREMLVKNGRERVDTFSITRGKERWAAAIEQATAAGLPATLSVGAAINADPTERVAP